MSAPLRVLLVRLSAIGDVVHTLPSLAALRRALPNAHIAWLVESLSAPLLEGHPQIDELIVYPRRQWRRQGYWRSLGAMRRFAGELRARCFDVAIDFQGLTKSAVIPWLARIPRRIGYGGADGREISRWFYTERITPPDTVVHVIYRNLDLLKALGVFAGEGKEEPDESDRSDKSVQFVFPDFSAERAQVDSKLSALGIAPDEKPALLNPGAGWETKRWPAESFGRLGAKIARELGCRVLLTWGPGEEALIDAALGEVPAAFCGRVLRAPATSLREFAALCDRACVMVGGDTGPTHLAAARGVPVVALYGGSDAARNGPLGRGPIRVLINPETECVPCWRVRCDNPPPRCLTGITPEQAFEAVCAVLRPACV
ncbi:MAG: glycosyltransferase family 9 protein [Candidatus Sumerlaeia bacterium]|nr:glycosyltransferase family 9 protein [Candidatus Sumerlaeia bacterium]